MVQRYAFFAEETNTFTFFVFRSVIRTFDLRSRRKLTIKNKRSRGQVIDLFEIILDFCYILTTILYSSLHF